MTDTISASYIGQPNADGTQKYELQLYKLNWALIRKHIQSGKVIFFLLCREPHLFMATAKVAN